MQAVTTIGLDIAKSVFQVHGIDAEGKVLIRRQLKRRYVLAHGTQHRPWLTALFQVCHEPPLRRALRWAARASAGQGNRPAPRRKRARPYSGGPFPISAARPRLRYMAGELGDKSFRARHIMGARP